MRPLYSWIAAGMAMLATAGFAQQPSAEGSYRVQKVTKVGGEGGFDYVYADVDGRRLYIARSGPSARVTAYNLDTLEAAGEIPMTNARGVATDAQSHHGFASSSPVAMWDTRTMALLKTIPVEGRPDGILNDAFTHRTFVFSHSAPNVTVLAAKDGAMLGTIDLGGAPEQAVSDGKGHLYVDLEDKDSVAVVDAKTMKVTATYGLNGKGGGNAGLALDAKNGILFVACRNPQTMVMLDASSGKVLADLPIGRGCDGAVFNPKTNECFSSQGDGTLTVIKETDKTHFAVEQNVKTMTGAKTLTLDSRTGRVLLIAAEYGAPTGPAPTNGRPSRGAMVAGSFSIVTVGK
jgi:DNA-binding beta-propeller fold protein YncE